MEWPYTVLLDSETGRAAAYDGTHRLITENASEALVTLAQQPGKNTQPWNAKERALGAQDRHSLPAWATPEVQARLQLIWVRQGSLTDAEWRALPKK